MSALLRSVLRALPSDECVPWPGKLTRDGYGQHRRVYEAAVGPVPPSLVLDHLCRRRDCSNPQHLEPVSHRENVRRGLLSRGVQMRSGLGWPVGDGRCT